MVKQLQKLELTWIGKGNEPQVESRILIEDPSKVITGTVQLKHPGIIVSMI